MSKLYAVLKMNVSDIYECQLLTICQEKLNAHDEMCKYIAKEQKNYHEVIFISPDRVELFNRTPGYIYGRMNELQYIFTIEEFIDPMEIMT